MKRQGFLTVLRVVYAGVAVAILLWVVLSDWLAVPANREANIALFFLMAILTLPAGIVVVALLTHPASPVAAISLAIFADRFAEAVGTWVVMFAAGWLQWFILVPWLVSTVNRWRAKRRAASA